MLACLTAMVAAAVLPLAGGDPASSETGDLDPAYGDAGIALIDAGFGDDEARTMAVMPNGEIVVTGARYDFDSHGSTSRPLSLVRFDQAGGVVQSQPFLGGDKTYSPVLAHSAATPDGKLVAAASSGGTNGPLAVVRYLPSGELDRSFGSNGVATLVGPSGTTLEGTILALAVAPDGAVLITGGTRWSDSNPWEFVVGRLRPDGRNDPAFGDGGSVVFGLSDQDGNQAHLIGQALARQPDGRLVIAGTLIDSFGPIGFVARFTAKGDLDRTFNKGAGFAAAPVGNDSGEITDAVAVLPDGRIVVGGTRISQTNADLVIHRFLADGRLDPSLPGGAVVAGAADVDEVLAGLAADDAGRVVVAGSSARSGGPADLVLARFGPEGRPDPGFAGGALHTIDLGGDDILAGFALDRGRPLLAATSRDTEGGDLAVLRFTVDGQPDRGFAGSGRALVDFGGAADSRAAMAIGPDGSLTTVGNAYLPSAHGARSQGVMVRQRPDGRADPAFRRRGAAFTAPEDKIDTLNDVVTLADGSSIVAGGRRDRFSYSTPGQPLLLRFRPDGSPDAGFGAIGAVVEKRRPAEQCCETFDAVAILPDGRLRALTVLEFGRKLVVAGYRADGQPDPGFGTDGYAIVDDPHAHRPWDIAALPDGGVVLGGGPHGSLNWSIIKLDAAGRKDAGFAPQLPTNDGATRFQALTAAPDGTVIAAAIRRNRDDRSAQLLVARLGADGQPDPRFDCDGYALAPVGGAGREFTIGGVVVGPDGRIVVGGSYHDGEDSYWEPAKEWGAFAARWLADGTPDTSLSADGLASAVLRGWRVGFAGVGLSGDNPVVAGSMAKAGSRLSDGFSLRFKTDGPPPAPEAATDRLLRCATVALSAGDVPGVVSAVGVAARQLAPAPPAVPLPPAPPAPPAQPPAPPAPASADAGFTRLLDFPGGALDLHHRPSGDRGFTMTKRS